jgi:hypothetical protein
MQGYLFSPPISAHDATRLLQRNIHMSQAGLMAQAS